MYPAPIPEDVKLCLEKKTRFPDKTQLNIEDTAALIAALKISENEKVLCGRRAVKIHDNSVRLAEEIQSTLTKQ